MNTTKPLAGSIEDNALYEQYSLKDLANLRGLLIISLLTQNTKIIIRK